MNSSTIRQLWSVISDSSNTTLFQLSDSELVMQLLAQLENKKPLSTQENLLMRNYISSRTLLIREIAQQA